MLWNALVRFAREEDGMEMVEWAIVGVVFALSAAAVWTGLKGNINTALQKIGGCVDGTDTSCLN